MRGMLYRGDRFALIAVLMAVLNGLAVPSTASPTRTTGTGARRSAPLREIVDPDWIKTPDGEALGAFYPKLAQMMGLDGAAQMNCVVTALGAVEDCKVTAEAPIGMNFGEAALKLAPSFRMRPKSVDGENLGGAQVTIPIRFQLQDNGEPVGPPVSRMPGPPAANVSALARDAATAMVSTGQLEALERKGIEASLSSAGEPIVTEQQAAAVDAYLAAQASRQTDNIEVLASAMQASYSATELGQVAAMLASPAWKLFMDRSATVATNAASKQRQVGRTVFDETRRIFCLKYACAAPPKTATTSRNKTTGDTK